MLEEEVDGEEGYVEEVGEEVGFYVFYCDVVQEH